MDGVHPFSSRFVALTGGKGSTPALEHASEGEKRILVDSDAIVDFALAVRDPWGL